ncbi:DNA polymerase III subunit gamma/tau [Shewanella avicenniae]|uniref:DNA-directed DNA polymerase n=1 Tax=Shewanella avicenniae TaxID=2814294 RepID=A0ABX7QN57_9GAMM|nr:DNA polymerase III subunit gamma/tau [Shewanella avicenniae]QSX32425.1 DNA polymerase III subunit gamma/tau [Shewanella avicenniae]
MSYQVLARKWRPANFEQVVGQSHVLHALTNALGQQRLHHAYLFTGTRGVGKTSLARLFAKGLNCETGITANPCGECSSCQEIAQGRFVDLIEVDAASRTKVDDTRELLDNVQYRPTRGRFKVYLIDEVHMLSRSSFNALLKTLEEPPEHVKFLLATTDPQKLPVTVLSRCLQFNLKSLSQQDIGAQLTHILAQEQVPTDAAAVDLLAKAANGSMRDALSLTDQAIAFGAGQVMLEQVQKMLGSVDERQVLTLLQALVNGDIAQLLTQADKVLAFGADANEILRSLLELLHQITLAQFAPAAAQLAIYAEQIKAFAVALPPEQVQLYYQLLLHGRKDLPFAPDPKSGLEMALLRAVAFEPKATPTRWLATDDSRVESIQLPTLSAAAVKSASATPAPVQHGAENASRPQVMATAEKTAIDVVVIDSSDSDDDDFADADDAALAAEQALIISQADSMGYQGYDKMAAEYDNEQSYASMAAADAMPEKRYVVEDAVDEQGTYEVPFHDELTGDMFGEAPAAAAQRQPIAEASDLQNNQPDEAATAQGTTATDSVATVVDSLFGDDLLDQVLASRDSLLKEIEALSADDVESTVSSPGRGLKKAAQEPGEALPEPEQPKPSHRDVTPPQAPVTNPLVDAREPQRGATTTASAEQPQSSAVVEVEPNIAASVPAESAQANRVEQPTGHADDLRWYKLVASINIGGRVRQLAANSVCYALGEQIKLLLKPDQKHLAAKTAVVQMEQAISAVLGISCEAVIEVGVDEQRETPQEIRHRFNRELLAQAKSSLIADSNVQWMMAQMGAELDEDSLSYPGEMLAEKTALIQP